MPDTAVDAVPTGPFTKMGAIFQLEDRATPYYDDDPTLTDDMLELYFSSTRANDVPGAGPADIWRSTRLAVIAPWSKPKKVDELNDPNPTIDDQNPGISGDGLMLWFSSNRRNGLGATDIYFTNRSARDQPWSKPRLVVELSTKVDDLAPEPARSLLRIAGYGDTPRQLFEATRASVDAPWSSPKPIDSLNKLETNNMSGFFVTDLELWFASDRPGGLGLHDIYRAVRPSIDQPFETLELVEAVSSESRDDDPWMSSDRRTLFFTSAETGSQEIYFAVRP